MFGEKEIIGVKIEKLVDGNKLKIPNFTNVEKDDRLFLTRHGKDFALYNARSYIDVIHELEEKLGASKDISERKELKNLIKTFYYSIIRELKCDSKHIVTLPNNIPSNDKITSEEILCIGQRRHLILRKVKKN